MKEHLKTILFYLLLIGVIIAVLATIFHRTSDEKLLLSDVVAILKATGSSPSSSMRTTA